MRDFLKRFTAALLAIVMTVMLLPAGMTTVEAATTSDGWTVATAWSTQSAGYSWNSTKDEIRQPKLYVTYRLEGATRDYAPGDLEFSIPGIGEAVRGTIVKADKIAADSADSEWTYTWDSVNDIYTFKNKFSIEAGGNVNGGFEFLWTMSSRKNTDGFRTGGTPTFTVKDGNAVVETIDMPDLSYRFTSQRDEYRISLSRQTLSASAWESLDRDYTWYDIKVNYQVSRHARGLHRSDTWIWFELPEGMTADDLIVMNGSQKVTPTDQDPDHPGQLGFYLSKALRGDICTSSTYKSFRIGVKADDGKVITINAHLDRLYLDEKTPVTTKTTDYEIVDDSLRFGVQSYGFRYSGYIYDTKIYSPSQYNRTNAYYNYQKRLNSVKLYDDTTLEFTVYGIANRNYAQSGRMAMGVPARAKARAVTVPAGITGIKEDQEWQMALGLDRIAAALQDGTIRALENSEYDITYVRIPSRADSKAWTLYAAADRNAPFGDYAEVASGDMKTDRTVSLPSGTKAFYILIDGIVGSYSQNVYPGVKFHLDYDECLKNGTLPDPEGNLVAFNSMRALYADENGNVHNDVAMSNGNYLGSYGKDLARHDMETHKEYLFRDYDEVFLRESITKLSTTVSPSEFKLNDSIFTSRVTATGSISADDPGELTKFSAFIELPDVVQVDVNVPITVIGSATDANGRAVTDFNAHASREIVDVDGKTMLRVDFDFTEQPLEISKQTSYSISFGAELRYSDFAVNGSQYTFKSYLIPSQAGLAKVAGDNIVTDVYDINGDGNTSQSMATHTRSIVIYDDVSEWREHTNKYVSSQASGGYVTETSVELRDVNQEKQPGAEYSYRLDYEVGSLTASNLVFYDRLEQGAVDRSEKGEAAGNAIAVPSGWQGTLASVDTSRIEQIKGIPTVYYSTDENQVFDLDAPGWTTEMPADKSSVKAVAVHVDTSGMENGVLGSKILAYVVINMTATSDDAAVHKKAVNQYTVTYNAHDVLGHEEGEYSLVSNETYVTLQQNVAKLVLQKADADNITGRDDAGNNKYATVYGGEFKVYDPDGKEVYHGGLNALGQIVIDPAEYGTYYWEEVAAPAGYEKAEGRHEVTLDGATNGKAQYMPNKRLPGSVVLTKNDSTYNGYGPLAGAEFELFTNSGDPVVTDANYHYDPAGDTGRFVTGADGKLTVTGLPWGSYYFVEAAAPDGYDLSGGKTAFTIGVSQYDAGLEKIQAGVSAGNSEQTASVRLVKKDAADGGFIDGATFSLYRKARPGETKDAEVKSGLRTDAVGEIQVDDLIFGEYYFVETRNASGYKMPEDDAAKTGSIVLDKTTVGQLEIIEYTNERRTGEAELLKTDDFGQLVEGAVYELYFIAKDGSEKLIKEYTTDAMGTIKADKLEWGEYYFVEKSAPEGYAVSDEKIAFTVTRENVSNVIYLTATDNRALGSVRIVKTGAGDPGKLLAGAVFELYSSDGTKQVPGKDYTTDMDGNAIVTGEDGTVTIKDIRQGGYYLVETGSPEGYSLDDRYTRFSVTLENVKITQELTIENEKNKASIKINKAVNDVYEEFGDPTFLFTVTGDDGRCYTASIRLSPDQLEGSTTINVDAGTYTIQELKAGRYDLIGIDGIANVTVGDGVAIADLTGDNTYAEATFTNEIRKYDGFSHTDSVVNLITAGAKLTGISVDYTGPAVLDAATDGYDAATKSYTFRASDMTVTAYYDDGTSRILDWGEFVLDHPQVRSTGDTSATINVSYSEGGIKASDRFSVGLDLPKSERYTVTIDCDGGMIEPDGAWVTSGESSLVDKLSKTLWENEKINLPGREPECDGDVFIIWQGSDGKEYRPGVPITVSQDLTLTAKWSTYNAKYAVRLYGINQDVSEDGTPLVTFGPAGGARVGSLANRHYNSGHVPADGKTCISLMTWEEIIAQCKSDPTVFSECLEKGCTHSVELKIKGELAGLSYAGRMDNGDGASALHDSINSDYRKWNDSHTADGGWEKSKIRNTLTGAEGTNGSLTPEESLFAMFPEELRNGIVPKKVISGTSSSRTGDLSTTYDTLWLFSSNEMYVKSGKNCTGTSYIDSREGTLYASQDADHRNAIGTSSMSADTVNCFYTESGGISFTWSRSVYGSGSAVYFYADGYPGSYSAGYENDIAPGFCIEGKETYDVKYAVRLYGIQQDVDEQGNQLGLTFGPAGGKSYISTFTSHTPSAGQMCLHDMTWEEIIAQSIEDPTVFQECLENGCTHSVDLMIKDSPIAGTSYVGKMDNGDGASSLVNSITSTYRYWNPSNNTGGWPDSKIRNTLNGEPTKNGTLSADQCLLAMFPSELQENIVPRKVLSGTVYNNRTEANIAVTYDALWLFSSKEMYKKGSYYDSTYYTNEYVDDNEGNLYQSQNILNCHIIYSTASTPNRFYNENGSTSDLWSRSLCGISFRGAVRFDDGRPSWYYVDSNFGVAPGFCLK